MKRFILTVLFVLILADTVCAFSVMSDARIKEAQEYGLMHYQKELPQFGSPWMVYEEKSTMLNDSSEQAYIFTPYYLVALNARERLLASETINLIDGKTILDENHNHNSLPVGIVLFSSVGGTIDNDVTSLIIQGGKEIYPYAMNVHLVTVYKTKVVQETLPPAEEQAGPKVADKSENTAAGKTDEDKIKAVSAKKDSKDTKNKEKKDIKDKEKKDDKEKEEDKDKKKKDDKKTKPEPEPLPEPVPEPVIVEKVVPDIYRVHLFFYFDIREIDINAASVLSVIVKNENERKFHIKLGSLL